MDYTIQEIRPLIYKDRKGIDCFDITGKNALDAASHSVSCILSHHGREKSVLLPL